MMRTLSVYVAPDTVVQVQDAKVSDPRKVLDFTVFCLSVLFCFVFGGR